jgi:predicted Rossmann fold flavoprotein
MNNEIWDVLVIGGGPAGMMAAGTAASQGKSVLLLEKNPGLGKKLLITGGGRCNVTNNKETPQLVASYRGKPKALFSVFSQFAVAETLDFFHSFGMATKEEDNGRMFPQSNSAETVWQVMLDYLKKHGVQVELNCDVESVTKTGEIFEIKTKNHNYSAKTCIIATGGKSRPETGSTGAGYEWLKKLGHRIKDNDYALVPVNVRERWVQAVSGISFENAGVEVLLDGVRKHKVKGKLLFTHFGLSGPVILNLSRDIGELLPEGEVQIIIDLLPSQDQGQLKQTLHELLTAESNRMLKNTLTGLIPGNLVPVILELTQIKPETPNHSVTKEQRQALRLILKSLPLTVDSLLGPDKAVVSSGGVMLDEVNMKTMESKLIPGLFMVGDVLDIDRPSGGYSLQLCWSTGYVAGKSAAG